jgi:hypothetical protein
MTAPVAPNAPPNRVPADLSAAPAAAALPVRSPFFTKYDALLVAVLGMTLLSGGIFEVISHYREHRAALIRIQQEQAKAGAAKISQFIEDVESQVGWTTQLPWSATAPENRRFDALRLLRQVPAITELMMVDQTGKERLRVSRLSMDVVDSGNDLSEDPKFTEAIAHRVYYGPVYFRRDSEPYMTLALAGARKDAGVTIAEVNLKVIWDLVSQVKVGEHGRAYVVSARGRLIAHPDMGLVLRNTDMSKLVQVKAAQADTEAASDELEDGQDIQGQNVLTAFAPIRPLRWTMFVERPIGEVYASLYAALQRLAVVLAIGLILTTIAGMLLTRRIVGPIEALRAGAAHLGSGEFALAFSSNAGGNPQSEALRSNRPLRELASSETLGIIDRSADCLQTALDTLVRSSVRLCSANCGLLDQRRGSDELQTLASFGFLDEFDAWRKDRSIAFDPGSTIGRALIEARPVQTLDVLADRESQVLSAQTGAVFRTMLAVPLLQKGKPAGVLILTRTNPQLFDDRQIDIATSFADLAAVLIASPTLPEKLPERVKAFSQPRDSARSAL